MRLVDRFKGALLGTFIGDAFGKPFEGRPFPVAPERIGVFAPRSARYSDDTQMMIATAESLVRSGGFDAEDMARCFLENFERGRGYGRGTKSVLSLWRKGMKIEEASRIVFEGGSQGNGAAMRTAPLACLYFNSPRALRRVAREAAELTHAHLLGWSGAVVQAAAVALAIESTSGLDPGSFLEKLTEAVPPRADEYARLLEAAGELLGGEDDPERAVATLGNGFTAIESVCTAVYSFLRHASDFTLAVRYAVSLGGDADTIGAMAGAIAGAYHGIAGIPEEWLNSLEGGPKGADHVDRLGEELFRLWESWQDPGITAP